MSSEIDYREIFQYVLYDFVRAIHCHACGERTFPCFKGYVGTLCDRSCERLEDGGDIYDYDSDEYDPNSDRLPHSAIPCGFCETEYGERECISRAHSRYHRHPTRISNNPSGYCWPMLDSRIPCENQCIRERDTIYIKGYNCDSKPPRDDE